ncbi:hypothetical protein CJ030_MR6G000178 [Morella rubra]|uniref:Uncharacterized protein n=1 Tax=Morella rubra TaxID=262757 RepID=A0A6A1VA99_9ROSI|nr:hypothetical protein CJ030_MR6G000178 [Morella rubra]
MHALTGSADADRFSAVHVRVIMDEAWEIKEYSLPYGVFLTQFLISRGVVIAASDTRKEVKSALNKFTLSRSRGQEGALTRRFARRAAAAAEEASRPSTSASEAPMETGAPAVPLPWVAQLFTDLDNRVSATVKATLQPVERQMQSLEEQLKELRTAFDGECTVTMLRNKSVVAHMANVNEQLEEIKKTLDDFKTEAIHRGFPEIFLMTWPLSVMLTTSCQREGNVFGAIHQFRAESSPGTLAVSGPSLRYRNELPSYNTASPVGTQSSCASTSGIRHVRGSTRGIALLKARTEES